MYFIYSLLYFITPLMIAASVLAIAINTGRISYELRKTRELNEKLHAHNLKEETSKEEEKTEA